MADIYAKSMKILCEDDDGYCFGIAYSSNEEDETEYIIIDEAEGDAVTIPATMIEDFIERLRVVHNICSQSILPEF